MNIVQMQDNLKDLSDRQLLGTMQTGTVPEYLVIAELQRRKKARQDAAPQQQRQPQSTVAEELMGGIAAAPAPNMQQFSAGGVVPFQEGGPTDPNQERIRAMMRANLRHMLAKQGVPPEQAQQVSDQAKNASIEQLESLMNQFAIAGVPEARADVAMPSAPTTLFPTQDYALRNAERIAEEGRIDTTQYGAPGAGVAVGAAKDLTLSGLRALETGVPAVTGFVGDVASDVGERVSPIFEAGPPLVGEDIYEAVDPYLTRFGSYLDERFGKSFSDQPEPGMYLPNAEMMAREAEAAPSWLGEYVPPPRTAETEISERTGEGVGLPPIPEAPTAPAAPATPEQPTTPTDSTGIGNVGRYDETTPTAPTAPTGSQVGTEQLAGMGEAELAQTREVAKDRPDFFSPEALMALGLGMIAGGSKAGSTFGSAVGEGGLAMLQQVQSKRKAEAEREKEAMLEAGRMERTRMEQAGALQRAGINAAAYEKQFAALNRQRAIDYAKIFIEPLQDPMQRLEKTSQQVEMLRKTDVGRTMSEKELQQQARANLDAELEQRLQYYQQLLLGAEGSMYGAPPMPGQTPTGAYNFRTQ